MHYGYLAALAIGSLSMVLLDWRFRLAFFASPRRAAVTILGGVLVFIIWDLLGIKLGIFLAGSSPYMSGILLAPELPLEEPFFLFFLCYFTLIVYQGIKKRWPRHT